MDTMYMPASQLSAHCEGCPCASALWRNGRCHLTMLRAGQGEANRVVELVEEIKEEDSAEYHEAG